MLTLPGWLIPCEVEGEAIHAVTDWPSNQLFEGNNTHVLTDKLTD